MTIPSIDLSGLAPVAPEADMKPLIAPAVVTAGALPPSPEAVARFQTAMAAPLAENARVDRLLTELSPLSLSPLSRSVQTVEGSASVVVGSGAVRTTPPAEPAAGRQLGPLQNLGRVEARPSLIADRRVDSVHAEGTPSYAPVHAEGTRVCAPAFAGGGQSPSIPEEASVRPAGAGPIAPDGPCVQPPVDGALRLTPPTEPVAGRQLGQLQNPGCAEARPAQVVDRRADFVHVEGTPSHAPVHSEGTRVCAPAFTGGGQLPSIPKESPARPAGPGPIAPDRPCVQPPVDGALQITPPAEQAEGRQLGQLPSLPEESSARPVGPVSPERLRPAANVEMRPVLDVEEAPDAERLVAAGVMPHAEVVSPGVAPVQTAEGVAPIAALSARAVPRQMDVLVEAATAVADTLLVSPGLLRGEGDILVQLKPDVLEGSQIRIAVTGQVFDVAFQPATPALAELLSAHLPELQQQLAMSLPAYHFNVKVAGSVRVAGRKVEA